MNISRRKFLRRAAVAVPAAAAVAVLPQVVAPVEAAPVQYEYLAGIVMDAPEEEVTFAFGLEGDPEHPVHLWCIKREDGKTFWVINGHWIFDPADPRWPGSVLNWTGIAPFEHSEYNEAMHWIREQIVV